MAGRRKSAAPKTKANDVVRRLEEQGVKRNIFLSTPHFLVVPLLLDQHPDLIATVPQELGNVFGGYGLVRVLEPPLPLPSFALRQHWHPRFHQDPAIIWLRELVKDTFDGYPWDPVPAARRGA